MARIVPVVAGGASGVTDPHHVASSRLLLTDVAEGTAWAHESVHPIPWAPLPANVAVDPSVTVVESFDGGATWRTVKEVWLTELYAHWTVPAEGTHGRVGVEFHLSDATGASTLVRRVETGEITFTPSQKKAYVWSRVSASAPFGARDGAGGIVYGGKMWLVGGWNPERFPLQTANDVWSSVDGATWVQEKPNTFLDAATFPATDWEGRHFAGYHAYDGKMWIVGGDPNQGYYQTDVWSSTDGRSWTRTDIHTTTQRTDPVTGVPYSGWRPVEEAQYGHRTAHVTGVFGDRLFVAGGQRIEQFVSPGWPGAPGYAFDDVWSTRDGATFTKIPQTGDHWAARGYVSELVEHAGRMWLVGGGLSEDPTAGRPKRVYMNDVWSSADGAAWVPVKDEPPFSPRIWHNVKTFDGRIWLMAGYDGDEPWGGRLGDNRGDAWYSTDGKNWYDGSPPPEFVPRHAATAWVHGGGMYLGSGNAMYETWHHDVWKVVPR